MVHVHGVRAQELSSRSVGVALERLVAVPVDVGKGQAMAMVCDFTGRRLAAPFEFSQDRGGDWGGGPAVTEDPLRQGHLARGRAGWWVHRGLPPS